MYYNYAHLIQNIVFLRGGVDVPSVDMVLFLRPTESPIVFLQQLGRGLRKSKGKEYLNVLDFIGNYEKAGRTRFFVKKEGAALALKDEMQEVINNPVFIKQMKDVVEYRVMDYYRRRYKEKGD